MSYIRKAQYDTHFYCALCGGPFAQVLRTPVNPAQQRYSDASANGADAAHEPCEPDPADLDPTNEFNYHGDDDRIIPEEVVEGDMSYVAARSRKLRLRAQKEGRRKGIMPEPSIVRPAYDGRRISTQQMKWTKNLRALINRKADYQPVNAQNYLEPEQRAYLTGRGLIRQRDSWADAFASIDEDEIIDDDESEEIFHTEFPVFSDSARARNTFGFQVYRELGPHTSTFISSIPFHDECWTLLDLAIEESGLERGLEGMNEQLDTDDLWDYLRSLITTSGEKQEPMQTFSECRKDAVTRLGDLDYREAQSGGEGWHWKHEDGYHWLAADPSSISVLDEPLKTLPSTNPLPYAPRPAITDRFMDLPAEVVLEICSYLTSSDVFCLKTASPAVLNVALPDSYYRSFLREEFKYLPKLKKEIEKHETSIRERRGCNIDWRGSFERLRLLMKTPQISTGRDAEDLEYGKEWDEVDIGLKNRSRIWKIVKPIAETLVEQSSYTIQQLHKATSQNAEFTSLVRGYVGSRSGKEGSVQTAYFGSLAEQRLAHRSCSDDDSAIEIETEEYEILVTIENIRCWSDLQSDVLCGMEFTLSDNMRGHSYQKFGREGGKHIDIFVKNKILAGFAFCMADGIITGAQLFHFPYGDTQHTEFSPRIGKWEGICRRVVVASSWRSFVGVTGFLNSCGFIETIGLLEEAKDIPYQEDQFGPLARPPRTVPLTHEEASLWRDKLPPVTVAVHEREGPAIPQWKMTGADWEIWERGFTEDGVDKRSQPRPRKLKEITGYYDDQFLRGLEFKYQEDKTERIIESLIGIREGTRKSSIKFGATENPVASVICFGDEGVHGILFVTDQSQVSDVFGPRYLGTHKVFAPPPNQTNDNATQTAYHREEIPSKILGLHALYDYEEKKFLQLGLILPLEEGFNLYGTSLTCDIPFDKMNDQAGLWDSGPPPEGWIIGSSDVFTESEANFLRMHQGSNDYCGWAKMNALKEVKIYGNFMGIKFSYTDSKKEIYFGYIGNEADVYVQTFDPDGGEKIIGFCLLEDEEETTRTTKLSAEEMSVLSATSRDEPFSAKRIHFITNRNEPQKPNPNGVWFTCEYFCGIKFDFNFNQITSYSPIYYFGQTDNSQQLCERVRLPWKKLDESLHSDPDIPIPMSAKTIAVSFRDNKEGRVDAVKGYVCSKGKFCGLLFRRDGKWSIEAFGQRSPYEVTFELAENEYFDSLYLPEVDGWLRFEALALSTNLGNTTPWIGRTDGIPRHRRAPPGHVGIGLFAAQEESSHWQQGYNCDLVGLLYRPLRPSSPIPASPSSSPATPRRLPLQATYHYIDPDTRLPWLNDLKNRTGGITFTRLGDKMSQYYSDRRDLGRAFSVFEPAQLLQVRVWCGAGSGVRGILGIRFRGTPEMGMVTAGDWPDEENKKLSSADKMNISGPDGERITRIKVAFQRLEQDDKIIGLSIETSFNRTKTIVSSSLCPEKPIDLNSGNVKTLECREEQEIVGVNGVFGAYQIYDIGLVLREKRHVPYPMPRTTQEIAGTDA